MKLGKLFSLVALLGACFSTGIVASHVNESPIEASAMEPATKLEIQYESMFGISPEDKAPTSAYFSNGQIRIPWEIVDGNPDAEAIAGINLYIYDTAKYDPSVNGIDPSKATYVLFIDANNIKHQTYDGYDISSALYKVGYQNGDVVNVRCTLQILAKENSNYLHSDYYKVTSAHAYTIEANGTYEPVAIKEFKNYMQSMTCETMEKDHEAVKAKAQELYNALSEQEKTQIATDVIPGTNKTFKQRYDYVLYYCSTLSNNPVHGLINKDNTTAIIVILVAAIVSISAISTLFLVKKKHRTE